MMIQQKIIFAYNNCILDDDYFFKIESDIFAFFFISQLN